MKRSLNYGLIVLLLGLGGCSIVTPLTLYNNSRFPIVLLLTDKLDRDTHHLRSLSVHRILPGEWSQAFHPYEPAEFIFDEGKNEVFAYDTSDARRIFFEQYPARKDRRVPIRLVYEENGELSVLGDQDDTSFPALCTVKPLRVTQLLREKEIVGP